MVRPMRTLSALLVVVLLLTAALPPAAAAAGTEGATVQAGDGFDPTEFGRPIDPQEQEQLSGEWWNVAFSAALGAADAAYTYARSRPFEPESPRYWTGMAASVLVGAGMGALSSATQLGTKTAKAAVKVVMTLYSKARSHVVNEAFSAGLKEHGY